MLTSLNDGDLDDLLWLCWLVTWQFFAAFNGFDNIHTFGHFAEDGVVSVQPWCGDGREEKLGAAGVLTGVGH